MICLDTNIIAYFVEENANYGPAAKQLLQKLHEEKKQTALTFLSHAELLVKPIKENNEELTEFYVGMPGFFKMKILYPAADTSILTAKLRAKYGLSMPDALNLAIAIGNKCAGFVTNDLVLKKVSEIKIILLK